MTPEEIALRTAENKLQMAQIELIKDSIKIGAPSLVAIVTAIFSAVFSFRSKKIDKKIADAEHRLRQHLSTSEAHQASIASLLERKRCHLEQVAVDFNFYSDNAAKYITQIIDAANRLKTSKQLSKDLVQRIREYDKACWESYSEANQAKRLLQLLGFSETAELIIEYMQLISRFREKTQEAARCDRYPSEKEATKDFQVIREKSSEFLTCLSKNYDSLVLEKGDTLEQVSVSTQ